MERQRISTGGATDPESTALQEEGLALSDMLYEAINLLCLKKPFIILSSSSPTRSLLSFVANASYANEDGKDMET
jgi:hypothetical protein